ncbi:metal-dependent hydrolase [Amnibacterium flavum]|uniref:Metal-dependent hydrolase n=1 Tax=Amnibacterium flavum TaxID=2173173 RepID=A0A2V1HP02_9MICO|nr:metal-dependent hydrolase [Amnibacterium flavum]PVZ94288.1 metal-dependent hydrolase [Amnibacterium flavum]
MTLPRTDTLVDYPAGAVESSSTVVHAAAHGDRTVVLLDRTAAHAVDSAWPDQGPDLGVLVVRDVEVPILDVVVGATDGTGLFLGTDVPVRKGTDGWAFVVAHLVDAAAEVVEGDEVQVVVDAAYRGALSAGHTACHLASLALNRALANAWSKEVAVDALGQPNFDALAVETTAILEYGSRDEYRIGKSLRRKGFDVGSLDALASLEAEVNETLTWWLDTGVDVRIDRDGGGLTDRRYWVCELPEGEARIPCGGTHVSSLSALGGISVSLELAQLEGALGLTMLTTALPGS